MRGRLSDGVLSLSSSNAALRYQLSSADLTIWLAVGRGASCRVQADASQISSVSSVYLRLLAATEPRTCGLPQARAVETVSE